MQHKKLSPQHTTTPRFGEEEGRRATARTTTIRQKTQKGSFTPHNKSNTSTNTSAIKICFVGGAERRKALMSTMILTRGRWRTLGFRHHRREETREEANRENQRTKTRTREITSRCVQGEETSEPSAHDRRRVGERMVRNFALNVCDLF